MKNILNKANIYWPNDNTNKIVPLGGIALCSDRLTKGFGSSFTFLCLPI